MQFEHNSDLYQGLRVTLIWVTRRNCDFMQSGDQIQRKTYYVYTLKQSYVLIWQLFVCDDHIHRFNVEDTYKVFGMCIVCIEHKTARFSDDTYLRIMLSKNN